MSRSKWFGLFWKISGIVFSISFLQASIVSAPDALVLETFAMTQELNIIHSERDAAVDNWIGLLSNCESGHNQLAINPMDLDGTPSHGRFQFKKEEAENRH